MFIFFLTSQFILCYINNDNYAFFQLGFLSAVPYIAYFVFINVGGIAADALQNAELLSTIATRRLAMIVG